MEIKDYKCKKCNGTDFFLSKRANHTGIFCSECGSWLKWANNDEVNLFSKESKDSVVKKENSNEQNLTLKDVIKDLEQIAEKIRGSIRSSYSKDLSAAITTLNTTIESLESYKRNGCRLRCNNCKFGTSYTTSRGNKKTVCTKEKENENLYAMFLSFSCPYGEVKENENENE